MLVGDAVMVGTSDQRGDETDIPEELATGLLHPHGHRVEVRTHGDPTWYGNEAVFRDYFEAAVWGVTLLERWTSADTVRIVPVAEHETTRRAIGSEVASAR